MPFVAQTWDGTLLLRRSGRKRVGERQGQRLPALFEMRVRPFFFFLTTRMKLKAFVCVFHRLIDTKDVYFMSTSRWQGWFEHDVSSSQLALHTHTHHARCVGPRKVRQGLASTSRQKPVSVFTAERCEEREASPSLRSRKEGGKGWSRGLWKSASR